MRLAKLKKDTFDKHLHTADIPGQYFCWCSFATWDVLLPTKEQVAKLARSCITTKFFWLQPEYMGTPRIDVTVCNVLVASFLSAYAQVEDLTQLRAAAKTAHGDYAFQLCLNRKGFQTIPDTISCQEKQMMVVVEGRQSHCWNCKQIGYLAKAPSCRKPQRKWTLHSNQNNQKAMLQTLPQRQKNWWIQRMAGLRSLRVEKRGLTKKSQGPTENSDVTKHTDAQRNCPKIFTGNQK